MLILQIAAGVILGGIGLYALRWIRDWWLLRPWRQRVIKVTNKQPKIDIKFLRVLIFIVALTAVVLALAYFGGAFR